MLHLDHVKGRLAWTQDLRSDPKKTNAALAQTRFKSGVQEEIKVGAPGGPVDQARTTYTGYSADRGVTGSNPT